MKRRLITGVWIFLSPLIIHAQDTTKIKVIDLDEITVAPNKFDEKLKNVAQPVRIISRNEIRFVNASSSADLLQQSGQVLVQKSQQGGGSPIIRGFEANKVLIVMDGVRMNNLIYRGGHLQNIITTDNSMFQSVEVLLGPGSVVYGSDALGGVMVLNTLKPVLSTSGKTRVTGNAFIRAGTAAEELSEHVDINIGGKNLASVTGITYSNFQDLKRGKKGSTIYAPNYQSSFEVFRVGDTDSMVDRPGSVIQFNSEYRQIDVLQKFLYSPKSTQTHLLNLQYSTSSKVPRYDRTSLIAASGKPVNAEWYYGPQKRLLTAYSFSNSIATKVYDKMIFGMAFQNVEESRHDRRFNSRKLNNRIENVNVYTANLDFQKFKNRFELRYGIDFSLSTVKSTAYSNDVVTGVVSKLDTRYPDGQNSMLMAAAYSTATYKINPEWVLNAGLRYSQINLHSTFLDTTFFNFPVRSIIQNNQAPNGNLGIVFLPNNVWKLALALSSGFRAPNVDDLSKVFETKPGLQFILPNPNLKPEYTYNQELNISRTVQNKIKIESGEFFTLYRNAITTGRTTFNGFDSLLVEGQKTPLYTNLNASKAFLCGIYGLIDYQITEHFSAATSVNYNYARIQTDSTPYPLDHIPPLFGRVSFMAEYPKWKAELFCLFNGTKKLADYNLNGEDNIAYATANGMPGWYTLNVRGSYSLNKNLSAMLAIENILDLHYRVFASNISAPGRNFILTLRGTF